MSKALTISSNFHYLDFTSTFVGKEISIDGGISEDNLKDLKVKHNDILYLCTDVDGDEGIPNGFDKVQNVFPDAKHIVFNPTTLTEANENKKMLSIQLFLQYEAVLNSMRGPIVICCKTATRASAVIAAYIGVKSKLSADEINEVSKQKSLKYLEKKPLVDWVSTVVQAARDSQSSKLVFRQLFESQSSTYTYLLADEVTREAILIDPVLETVDRDIKLIEELGLTLRYGLNTHVHADHVTGMLMSNY